MFSKFGKDHWNIILLVVVLAMAAEIFYLIHQNRKLQAMIDDPKQYFQTLSADDVVPAITAMDINGADVSLRYSPQSPASILFWFAPECASCEDNIDFWNQLAADYGSDKLRFLGMCAGSPDEARAYADAHGLTFPVVCAEDDFMVKTYKGNVLPQTVLISPEGRIIKVWPGGLNSEREAEIITLLQGL